MSLWRPEDFLSPEELAGPHLRACQLDPPDRDRYLEVIRRDDSRSDHEANRFMRTLAERGVVEAQVWLGGACMPYTAQLHGLTQDEQISWHRRAAGSGVSLTEGSLANCLYEVIQSQKIPRKSLLVDEMLFWYWRGAKALDASALTALSLFVGRENYRYKARPEENYVEYYQWKALHGIARSLDGGIAYYESVIGTLDDIAQRKEMTPEMVAEARERTRQWLLKNPDGIALEHAEWACWGDEHELDFTGLNRRLADLRLHYDPATRQLRSLD